jgi:uncharacterized protein (TIGR02001 family)
MKKSLLGAAGVLLLAAQGAQAQFSTTFTVASEYDFRGFSLSEKDPALQGSLDYAFSNGFAIGAWASQIRSGPGVDGNVELDLYAGFEKSVSDAFGWNAGVVLYAYPGSDDLEEYPEVYAGITSGPFAFTQWFTHDYAGTKESAWYSHAGASFGLPANFTLDLGAGYSYGKFWDDSAGGSLFDWSVGVGYELKNFTTSLRFIGTDASGEQRIREAAFNNEPRVVFSISTTLPWGK